MVVVIQVEFLVVVAGGGGGGVKCAGGGGGAVDLERVGTLLKIHIQIHH